MDIAILISVYGVAIGIVIACVFYVWQTKNQIESLTRENEKLKIEVLISRDYNEPRDITADRHLIRLARGYKGINEVRVIGINSLGVVHQAREDIIELLKSGKSVKFLLLNPTSDEFINRIKEVECKPDEDFESHKQRLIAEWNSTVMILRSVVGNIKNKNLLLVKVRREKPTYAFSATVSRKKEECFAWINEYPSEGRGTRGKQFLCRKSVPAERYTYEKYMGMFETSWNNADSISIDGEG